MVYLDQKDLKKMNKLLYQNIKLKIPLVEYTKVYLIANALGINSEQEKFDDVLLDLINTLAADLEKNKRIKKLDWYESKDFLIFIGDNNTDLREVFDLKGKLRPSYVEFKRAYREKYEKLKEKIKTKIFKKD